VPNLMGEVFMERYSSPDGCVGKDVRVFEGSCGE
jgi:hypothetical protein